MREHIKIKMIGNNSLNMPRTAMMCGAIFVCLSAYADQDSISEKHHIINEVTVTARRAPNKVASAIPVQTLSASDLEQLGVRDMADAVRRFAGVNVKDYGGIGGLKSVSIRNMGASHTGVSYDGAAVSNCQAGQIDIGRFSLDNVAMLSLSIGQGDDMLQPAKMYSSAGVLSIATERPRFKAGQTTAMQLQLKGGSFGYVSPAYRWWQKIGENTSTSLAADFLRADGNYPFTLVNGKYITKERRYNSAVLSTHGEGNLYHTFNDGSELQFKGYYYYSARELPGSVTLYNPIANERLWDQNAFAQARYRKEFSPKFTLQVLGKYNYAWNKLTDIGNQYSEGWYCEKHHQNEYTLSASALYSPIKGFDFSLAQDWYLNTLRSTMPSCPFPTRNSFLTALTGRYKSDRLTVMATLLSTATDESVKIGNTPADFHRLSPSASVSFQPVSSEQFYLRALYKSTFRLPSFNDLYYYRLGNRSLNPETANEYNLGITWSKSLFSFMDYLTLTVDGYYNDVKDKIVAFPGTYTWRMVNYGKVRVTGVDITLASAFSLAKGYNLIVSGAYTWQKAIDLTDPTAKNYKDQLPYTPVNSGNVSAIIETKWVNVGYSVVGVGKRYYMAQNIPANEIAGYTDQTLSLSHEFLLRGCALNLQGEILNLTNKQYDVIKYYPMPGRSWRISGTFKF